MGWTQIGDLGDFKYLQFYLLILLCVLSKGVCVLYPAEIFRLIAFIILMLRSIKNLILFPQVLKVRLCEFFLISMWEYGFNCKYINLLSSIFLTFNYRPAVTFMGITQKWLGPELYKGLFSWSCKISLDCDIHNLCSLRARSRSRFYRVKAEENIAGKNFWLRNFAATTHLSDGLGMKFWEKWD